MSVRNRRPGSLGPFAFALALTAPLLLVGVPLVALASDAAIVETGAEGDLAIGEILYLSRSSVYLDQGEFDGLTVDTPVTVYRKGRRIGELQVSYLARHSASCRIVTVETELQPGDEVRYRMVATARAEPRAAGASRLRTSRSQARFSGQTALEWNAFADSEDTDGDFQQPSLYLQLQGDRLLDQPLQLNVRLRTDYLDRSRALGAGLPAEDWVYRIYRLNLAWDDPERAFRVTAGRIVSSDLRSIGSWDGGLVELRPGDRWRFGLLGGSEPELLDGSPDFERQKFGGYATLHSGDPGGLRHRSSVGLVGQYESGTVSREYLVLTNELTTASRVRVWQDLELDFNRDWRKNVGGGNPTTLGRFNVLLERRFAARHRAYVAYDYFRNVRRLDSRDLPDSLFFDPRLQGLRVGGAYGLSPTWSFQGSAGVRDQEHEDKRPFFGTAGATWADALGTGTRVQVNYAYSDGRYAESHAPSLDLQRQFSPTLRLGFGLGAQTYDGIDGERLSVDGQWARLTGTWIAARNVDLQWLVSQSIGDVAPGTRGFVRLGYRL